MGKLAEFATERAAITSDYNESKRSIHENYMCDLDNLEKNTTRRRRALARKQRELWNKALAVVKEEETDGPVN